MERLEQKMDFLLSAALRKCKNLQDAEDLAQETMLAALSYEARGGRIRDIRPWLVSVLDRKYCDMLRRQYRRPTVSIGADFDMADESGFPGNLGEPDEAGRVRRGIAYLADLYREVTVRHYMEGQTVAEIASAMDIPEGTVKSRLSVGREHIRKGMESMEFYERQSYRPVRLHVSNSGQPGMNGQPGSLAEGDLIAQNLLFLAYEKPVTETELAGAIGIPMAYVEPIIEKLTGGGLMRRTGSRLYTDFMICTDEDRERYIPAQKEFVERHFQEIWEPYEIFRGRLRETALYRNMDQGRRNALEWFCFFHIFDYGQYQAFSDAFRAGQIFPDRPDGGKWIAFGHVLAGDSHASGGNKSGSASCTARDMPEQEKYNYGGQNTLWLEDYLGSRSIRMSLYYPQGFSVKRFDCPENGISEENLLKLLYIIESGKEIRESGFDGRCLASIPWLAQCGILRYEGNRPALNIPAFSGAGMDTLEDLLKDAQNSLAKALAYPLKDFLKGKKKRIPEHLKSVPLQKQYMYGQHAMLMITLRRAIQSDLLCGRNAEGQYPCPMILVTDP